MTVKPKDFEPSGLGGAMKEALQELKTVQRALKGSHTLTLETRLNKKARSLLTYRKAAKKAAAR